MQCKDIEDGPLLQFVARKQAEKGMWVNTWDFEPPYSDLPNKLFRAKMGSLMRRGLLDGCNCGCRGDYEMTEKGREFIEWELALDNLAAGSDFPQSDLGKHMENMKAAVADLPPLPLSTDLNEVVSDGVVTIYGQIVQARVNDLLRQDERIVGWFGSEREVSTQSGVCTVTVTEFLEARIAEDEAAALPFRNDLGETKQWQCDEVGGAVRYVGPRPFGLPDLLVKFDIHAEAAHVARWDPARVLAECAAKRAILAECRPGTLDDLDCGEDDSPAPMWVARALAAVYADHADYDKEWAL